jgi:hypothetical protein
MQAAVVPQKIDPSADTAVILDTIGDIARRMSGLESQHASANYEPNRNQEFLDAMMRNYTLGDMAKAYALPNTNAYISTLHPEMIRPVNTTISAASPITVASPIQAANPAMPINPTVPPKK